MSTSDNKYHAYCFDCKKYVMRDVSYEDAKGYARGHTISHDHNTVADDNGGRPTKRRC
jgi:hypothetical protein